jgi:hypothetical protein
MERKIKKKKKLNLTEMQDKGCTTSSYISLSGIVLFVLHSFFCTTFLI